MNHENRSENYEGNGYSSSRNVSFLSSFVRWFLGIMVGIVILFVGAWATENQTRHTDYERRLASLEQRYSEINAKLDLLIKMSSVSRRLDE